MTRRLLGSYLALAAIVMLVLAIPLAVTFGRLERRNLVGKIERDAVVIASVAEDPLQARATGAAFDNLRRFIDEYTADVGGRTVVVDARGDAVADTSGEPPEGRGRSFASRPEIKEALAGRIKTGERFSHTLNRNLLYVAVPVASGGSVHGAVRITYPTAEVDDRVRRVWLMLVGLGLTVLALAALLGLHFARAIAGPLGRVERTAVAAGQGDLTVRAEVGGPPEVRSLATRFNQMIARLGELVKSQEAFVADASHQLRTPLAALRLRLENLEAARPEDAATVEAAVAEVDRLGRMVDGLLLLARADVAPEGRQPILVDTVVRERVDLWSALAAEQGVSMHADVGRSCRVLGGTGRLEQVLDNLIENALGALGENGGTIRVGAACEGPAVVMTVVDDGPGMNATDRERAFDRFWRSERQASEGTGLGLAIVRRLVQADGGRITLEQARGGGLAARIVYPGAPPTQVSG